MSTTTSQPSASAEPVPRLRDGDRLSVPEFLRRYAADPVVLSAELIQGVVYINRKRELPNGKGIEVTPISAEGHAEPDNSIQGVFCVYAAHTPGTRATSAATVLLPGASGALEPDGTLRVLANRGGKARVGDDGWLHGVPELIAETSFTSGPRDFGPKYAAYESAGVPEYLVWRTAEQEVHWFALRNGAFVPLEPDAGGIVRSAAFPGLWLNVPALLAGDNAAVLATLQLGLASPEHAAFVARLQAHGA
jgi:Putative restriction endonuclease